MTAATVNIMSGALDLLVPLVLLAVAFFAVRLLYRRAMRLLPGDHEARQQEIARRTRAFIGFGPARPRN